MPKQSVPDIHFDKFVISEIKQLFKDDKIFINKEYQRGDIWTNKQRVELIESIENPISSPNCFYLYFYNFLNILK